VAFYSEVPLMTRILFCLMAVMVGCSSDPEPCYTKVIVLQDADVQFCDEQKNVIIMWAPESPVRTEDPAVVGVVICACPGQVVDEVPRD